MKTARVLIGIAMSILGLLLCGFFILRSNGLVFVDNKPTPNVHLDFAEYGEHIYVPVIATFCEFGYEKLSEDNDIILLQKGDQILTVDLNALSLTCSQSKINCIDPMPGNSFYFCERKGNEIMIDSLTFSGTLSCANCDYVITFEDPRFRIVKFMYHERMASDQVLEEFLETLPEESSSPDTPDIVTEGRLIVNGVDITDGNYVRIHHGTKKAELPMLAILRSLGYDAQMQYNAELDIYESVIGDQVGFFSTKYEDYNCSFPVGEHGCVRKIENNDFIIDSESVFSSTYWFWQAEIKIDYDTSTVYVDSCDPWA